MSRRATCPHCGERMSRLRAGGFAVDTCLNLRCPGESTPVAADAREAD